MKSSAYMYNKYLSEYAISDNRLADLQRVGFLILNKFSEICEENGLRYALAYGTLLGAVRHKGFIPWDDDIDVMMPRADYEKLCEILNDSTEFKIISRDTEKKCPLLFAKMMLKGTKLIEVQSNIQYGCWIDIFILDYAPSGKIARKLSSIMYRIFCRLASLSVDFKFPSEIISNKGRECSELRKYYAKRRFMGFFASIMPISFWTKAAQLCVKRKRKTEYLRTNLAGKLLSVKEFEERIEYDFEGSKFYGIADYDTYLKEEYGDYMTLPSEDRREKHIIAELDLGDYECKL